MNKTDLERLSATLRTFHIAVVGDVFLDKYTHGLVQGTSKETPVPLYEFEDQTIVPGAAGNVASNFASLAAKVSLVGFIGDDEDGRALLRTLQKLRVRTDSLIRLKSMRTNSYEKLVARAPNGKPQEILLLQTRMSENRLTKKARQNVLRILRKLSKSLDAVVVVDQVSHLCNRTLFDSIGSLCKKRRILSVGNSRHQMPLCKGFDLLVANELEAAQVTGNAPANLNFNALGRALLPQARKAVLLTTGPDGMRLFEKGSKPLHHPSVTRSIVDITGAGDTALAAYVCGRLAKLPPTDALFLGNAAAAVAIAKPGTATASLKEIASYV